MTSFRIMTIFYKGLTRNREIGKSPRQILQTRINFFEIFLKFDLKHCFNKYLNRLTTIKKNEVDFTFSPISQKCPFALETTADGV